MTGATSEGRPGDRADDLRDDLRDDQIDDQLDDQQDEQPEVAERQVDQLELLGSMVPDPQSGLEPTGPDLEAFALLVGRYGRLAELARWWRSTGAAPGGPRSPVRLWACGARPLTPPDDIDAAIGWGAAEVDAAADAGADLLLVSAPDRIAGRVLAAHLIDLDPVEATGWPGQQGLTDAQWADDVAALRDGLRRVAGLRGTPVPMLRALGSPVVAATTAALLRACARGVPAVLDGQTATAAALLARRIAPAAQTWWQLAAAPDDPLTGRMVNSLRLDPLTTLGITVEDGTSAGIALGLLQAAAGLPLGPDGEPVDEP